MISCNRDHIVDYKNQHLIVPCDMPISGKEVYRRFDHPVR